MTRVAIRTLGVAAAFAAVTIGGVGPAHAAPAPPAIVFEENFEHDQTAPGTAILLNGYTGAPPTSMTYGAHPEWTNGPNCNGLIGALNASTGTTGCSKVTYDAFLGPLAAAIGATFGGGEANHALGNTTIRVVAAPPEAATLETISPVPLSAADRFITFSIDVAVTACRAPADPLLRFYLIDGTAVIPTSASDINPCEDHRSSAEYPRGPDTIRVGRYAADTAILVGGGSVGVRLGNAQIGGNGNDYSVDNLRILDATPQLEKAFVPDRIQPGATSTLTFTVTNTSELASKAGWTFTDELPDGVTVAGPGTTTCQNGQVTAPSGGTTVSASGDLANNQESCTVSVPVTASVVGAYVNGPDDVEAKGLNPPPEATLTVEFPPIASLCRGTPLSAFGLRPGEANGPETPCRTDSHSLARFTATSLLLSSTARGNVLGGATESGPRSAVARASVLDAVVDIPGLSVHAKNVHSEARSELRNRCTDVAVSGTSSVATLVVNGTAYVVGGEPRTIPLPGLGGAVRVNQRTVTGSVIDVKAVFVDLPGTALDVVLGESKAGMACVTPG